MKEYIIAKLNADMGDSECGIDVDIYNYNKSYEGKIINLNNIEINDENRTFVINYCMSGVDNICNNIQGAYKEKVKIPTAIADMSKDYKLSRDDFEFSCVNPNDINSNIVINLDNIVGKILKSKLRRGSSVKNYQIRRDLVIKKGDVVDLLYIVKNISIKRAMIAMEDGYDGDNIRLAEVNKKDVKNFVYGKVSMDGKVYASHF